MGGVNFEIIMAVLLCLAIVIKGYMWSLIMSINSLYIN